MVERGIVIKNNEQGIDIQMQPSDACEGCSACFMDRNKLQTLHIDQNIAVKPGDMVEIEVQPGFAIRSAFLIFFLPLLMLVLGYYLLPAVVNIPGLNALYEGIIGAISTLLITYMGVHYYDRRLQKSGRGSTRIKRIVQ